MTKMKWNKVQDGWVSKDYTIKKRPILDGKFVYHVYHLELYIAYCTTLQRAKDKAQEHFEGLNNGK